MLDDPLDSQPDDIELEGIEWDVADESAAEFDLSPDGEPSSDSGQPPDDKPLSPPGISRPGIGRAILVILFVSTPLLAILYLGHTWLGIPFPPFTLVNWLNRTGYAPWVRITDALIGSTAVNADDLLRRTMQAQWILGVALFFLLALIVGILFYAVKGRRGRSNSLVAVFFGLMFVAPFFFAGLALGDSTLSHGIIIAWLTGWGIIWALFIDDSLGRLTRIQVPQSSGELSPTGIDRRQFLIQMGAGAAALATIGSAAAASAAKGQDAAQLQRTLPMISPELLEAQQELFGRFRRFAIVRNGNVAEDESNVLALGAEYPDRNYVSIWIGGSSPIIVYENLRSALAAYGTEDNPAGAYFLDE